MRQTADRIVRRRVGVVVAASRGAVSATAGAGSTGATEHRSGSVPDDHTFFEIGSITKVFTALLLADGAVRGDWELRTPVRELLPAGAAVPTRGGAEVTLQHLATHTSGLVRSPFPFGVRETLRLPAVRPRCVRRVHRRRPAVSTECPHDCGGSRAPVG